MALSNYEVFTGTGQWVKATANNFPSNAIAAGYEAECTIIHCSCSD
ncbi:MAG: DUF3421 domain-containing protein [Saprospiraceae bacterium]|nr:DUF3421 domain-containing protein [Saprospiraceae bacterium]